MAIHSPGRRFRYHKLLGKKVGKRNLAVILSLTAMVDMFTVLVIFLLQNYNSTGEILYIPKEVVLPKAHQVKELAPAIVVTVSRKEVLVDRDVVSNYDDINKNYDVAHPELYGKMKEALATAKSNYDSRIRTKIKTVVSSDDDEATLLEWNRITLQADKDVDLAAIKRVMGTISQAGAYQINFAVSKQVDEQK